MSCYHPMVALKSDYSKSYKPKYKFFGKLDDLGKWEDVKKIYSDQDPILLPCGNCKGCRLDSSRTWADRMCLEYDHTKKAVFVTLTYDDEHLPINVLGFPTLVKKDLQTFMKDLRGNKYYDSKEIRFYASGEYGEEPRFGTEEFMYGRPHFHVILFGLELSDFTDGDYYGEFKRPEFFSGRSDHKLYYSGQNELHQPYWRSPHLDNIIWKKGRCCITEFSWKTAAYCARYVRKKLNGYLEVLYNDIAISPPFSLMSRRPGIAGYFMEDHPEKDFFEETTFSFKGHIKPIPNYVFDKLEAIDIEHAVRYHKIKEDRKKFAEDKMLLELQQTDLSYDKLLRVKEQHAENVTKHLKRDRIEKNIN